jgi:hypothetical protein
VKSSTVVTGTERREHLDTELWLSGFLTPVRFVVWQCSNKTSQIHPLPQVSKALFRNADI